MLNKHFKIIKKKSGTTIISLVKYFLFLNNIFRITMNANELNIKYRERKILVVCNKN